MRVVCRADNPVICIAVMARTTVVSRALQPTGTSAGPAVQVIGQMPVAFSISPGSRSPIRTASAAQSGFQRLRLNGHGMPHDVRYRNDKGPTVKKSSTRQSRTVHLQGEQSPNLTAG